jgi:hypothetical protein
MDLSAAWIKLANRGRLLQTKCDCCIAAMSCRRLRRSSTLVKGFDGVLGLDWGGSAARFPTSQVLAFALASTKQ